MGFPFDLTELMAEEHGLEVSREDFEARLQQHVEKSRNARKAGGDDEPQGIRKLEAKETAYLEDTAKLVPTEHSQVYTWHEDVTGATVQAIFDGENFVDHIELTEGAEAKQYGIVLDKSNFYYESGGQLADSGVLSLESDPSLEFVVDDCQSSKGFIVHAGVLDRNADEEGSGTTQLKVGDKVTCKVNYDRRGDLAKNHTCTHLLNFALRKAVAANVDQKGSLVTDRRLRFDFNSPKAVPLDQLVNVETIVRKQIRESLPVHTKVVPLADAQRISSLRAVFGETYPDPVRVVTVGPTVDEVIADPLSEKWQDFSIELCGGTHLTKSSEARAFSLVQETALAKGVRRVICLTGDAAFKAASEAEALRARLEATAGLSGAALQAEQKALQKDISEAVISVSDKHELQQQVEALTRRLIALQKEEYSRVMDGAMQAVGTALEENKPFVIYHIPDSGAITPKVGGDIGKKTKKTPIAVFLVQANQEEDTVHIFASVPKPLQGKLSAKDWVENAGTVAEVKGGGSPACFNGKGAGVGHLPAIVSAAADAAAVLN